MLSVKSVTIKHFKSLTILALLGGTLGLTSCMDDNEPIEYPAAGYVSIYNGAPSNKGVIVYADQNKVNDFSLKYSETLGYKNFFPGDRQFKFTENNSLISLLEKKFKIKVDSVYSIFMVEDAGVLDAILIDDDWSEPTSREAQIRMVNLSPDSGSVSLMVDAVATPVFEKISFKSNSAFKSLATKTYNLKVISNSGDTIATASKVELRGNRVYTLVLRGYKQATETTKKLDLQLLTNYIDY